MSETRRYIRITLEGFGTYLQPIEELQQALDGEFDSAPPGTRWTLELVEMDPADFERLPEFQGH